MENSKCSNNNRFTAEQETPGSDWWIVTDRTHGVRVRFERGRFNESQQVLINRNAFPDVTAITALDAARIMNDIAEWVATEQSWLLKSPVFRIIKRDGTECVIRDKFPGFVLEVKHECTAEQLASSLRKCSEYLRRQCAGVRFNKETSSE